MLRKWLLSTSGIVTISILFHLLFIAYPISRDVNRYAWEGMIQNKGVNPYHHSPAEFESEFAADPVFQGIPNKDGVSVQAPMTLLLFRALSFFSYPDHNSSLNVLFT